ncbi:MAG: carboxypeptidase-like regulatory domain-containing protein, partial [Cyclonatronaceae bacterium]
MLVAMVMIPVIEGAVIAGTASVFAASSLSMGSRYGHIGSEWNEADGYGIIFGMVRDAETQEILPGANVVIREYMIGDAADVDGRYTLRRVPAGDVRVQVSYLGFETKEIDVTLAAGQQFELNIELEADLFEGAEVFVTALQRGQSRALTAQRQAVSIRSVVSSEQIDQFADATVSDALQRVSGMGHGGSNIRGVGAGFAKITMDGQRMGSTES